MTADTHQDRILDLCPCVPEADWHVDLTVTEHYQVDIVGVTGLVSGEPYDTYRDASDAELICERCQTTVDAKRASEMLVW